MIANINVINGSIYYKIVILVVWLRKWRAFGNGDFLLFLWNGPDLAAMAL